MEQDVLDKDLLVEGNKTQHEYAGFWIRVGASLIDLVVYLPLLGLNMYNLYFWKSLPLQMFTAIVLMIYKPLMEYQYGGTLGKMAVRIKVLTSDSESIGIQHAVVRNSPSLISQGLSVIAGILMFMNPEFESATSMLEVANLQEEVMPSSPGYIVSLFYMVSCIAVAFNPIKQGIHDLMARTICVRY